MTRGRQVLKAPILDQAAAEAAKRIPADGRMRIELGVEPVQRRAIGTHDFVLVAHVEEHVRMIVGWRRAHAHEFLGADLDHRHARIVVEMGNDVSAIALTSDRA